MALEKLRLRRVRAVAYDVRGNFARHCRLLGRDLRRQLVRPEIAIRAVGASSSQRASGLQGICRRARQAGAEVAGCPMTDAAFDSADFLRAVRALRVLSRRHADLAHYAAQWWQDEAFNAKVAAVD